jgi:DNA-binding CsgD family transcriptional regulator
MQPELWTTFLQDFTQLLGLPAAAILHQDVAREKYGFNVAVGLDPVAQSLYEQYYGQIDAWRPKFLQKAEGELAFGDELCPPSTLEKTEFYCDLLSKYDVNLHCSVATVKRPQSLELISLYRGLHDGPLEPEILATIKLVIPHIRSALQLRMQMREAEVTASNYAAVLDSMNAGVILLNDRNECLFVSRQAEKLCAADDGIYIRHSRLGAHRSEDHRLLHAMIDRAIGLATGKSIRSCGTTLIPRRSGAPLKISALSLSPGTPLMDFISSKRAVVALFMCTTDEALRSLPHLLMATYGLTGAEARLSAQLFEGSSLAQAAEHNQVSRETVRAQLRSIFGKTQIHRQADLLRLFTQLVQVL